MATTEDRPYKEGNDDRGKDTGRKGDHAKVGFPGKLQAARSTAPDDATDDEIQNVAWVAHKNGRDPADVWTERGAQ